MLVIILSALVLVTVCARAELPTRWKSRIDEGRCSKVTNRADAREAKWSKAAPHIARPRRLTIAQTYLPEVRERKEF